jgi:hypothetical protein
MSGLDSTLYEAIPHTGSSAVVFGPTVSNDQSARVYRSVTAIALEGETS